VIYNKSLESGPILKSGMISLNQLTVDLSLVWLMR
jgi:hypothetical protein